MTTRFRNWPWLTLQIIAANVVIITLLALAWYLTFKHQSSVYSDRLMSTFNIEPGRLHAMYVDDVERQLWISVGVGLVSAIAASIGVAFLIARPIRSLAQITERLRHGDYTVRAEVDRGEVGRLADNFNALAVALQQEELRRAQFMTDLGHELRTPIMSLQGYTEGLEDGVFKADDGYFKLISSELKHLTALTHTIETMQLNHTDSDTSESFDSITISQLLENAKCGWRARFKQRGLKLTVAIPPSLKNHRLKTASNIQKQIIDNLLSNMFRYASATSPCKITVELEQNQNRLVLTLSNEATDISEQTVPFLFDRFYRVSQSRTRILNEHPSGLGLAVVRQLCLSSGGNATAKLSGSRLFISLSLPFVELSDTAEITDDKSERTESSNRNARSDQGISVG